MHLSEIKVGWVHPVAAEIYLKISLDYFFFFFTLKTLRFLLLLQKCIPTLDKKGMSSWRYVFILQEDGTINTPRDEHVFCIECNSWTRKLWYLLFICYTESLGTISELNQQHSLAVDIFTFKIEYYLESLICWATAFSGVIHLLSFLILTDFLFSPPSSHSSAVRAPVKPGPGFFLGFSKSPCVHFHHICCLMLRHSSCKLLKIPYSAMRANTSKCWTIVSLLRPLLGLD